MNEVTLNGSCLCGAVRYEVVGDLQRFYHCHCSRCRKSSGTGHATNLMLANARILFSHGEALLKRYKVPDAERFTRQFCSECGSSVARFVPEIN
ncbi:MAG: GFA family protein, partial [Proteobacteria bacterium]|nr:GFA family protein [Pseudomonadota bacterium]